MQGLLRGDFAKGDWEFAVGRLRDVQELSGYEKAALRDLEAMQDIKGSRERTQYDIALACFDRKLYRHPLYDVLTSIQ